MKQKVKFPLSVHVLIVMTSLWTSTLTIPRMNQYPLLYNPSRSHHLVSIWKLYISVYKVGRSVTMFVFRTAILLYFYRPQHGWKIFFLVH